MLRQILLLIFLGEMGRAAILLNDSFRTLLDELSTIVRNTCEARVGKNRGSTFQMTTTPNPAQQRALQLLQAITV